VTSDSTLRIFLPVLDSPQHLQLHASLDLFSSLPFPIASNYSKSHSNVFWLGREVIGDVLITILKNQSEDDGRNRRLREIKEEGWDLFLRVLRDGSVVVTAVAVGSLLTKRSEAELMRLTRISIVGLQRSSDNLLFSILYHPRCPVRRHTFISCQPPTARR
jgi:hypothetical protein